MAVYDAFVSYSHAKDKPIAAALQSVVQKLGKPWYRRRALRIFRDDTSLSATPGLWPAIEQALFEHYEPYAEAVTAGELPSPSEALPRIAAPSEVWSHVSLVFVSITPLSGFLTTELGYTTAWDDEHTLGARFQSGKYIELCGSVLSP